MDNTKDLHRVSEVLQGLCAAHGKKFSSALLKVYWSALEDLSREEFDRAAEYVMKNNVWWPLPAHFRRALQVGWI